MVIPTKEWLNSFSHFELEASDLQFVISQTLQLLCVVRFLVKVSIIC